MNSKKENSSGNIPTWLEGIIGVTESSSERKEIEAKFVLKIKDAKSLIEHPETKKYTLEQFYLPVDVVIAHLSKNDAPDEELASYSEWRIRKKNTAYLFTCKRNLKGCVGVRDEYETPISKESYKKLKYHAQRESNSLFVKKTRYTRLLEIAEQPIAIEVDVYTETGAGITNLDFVTCEIEVPKIGILDSIRSRAALHPALSFLGFGLDATDIKQLSNKYLAQYGFIKETYKEFKQWLKEVSISNIIDWVDQKEGTFSFDDKEVLTQKLGQLAKLNISKSAVRSQINQPMYLRSQGVLESLAFKLHDSIGRIKSDEKQTILDQQGNGWLRDFHVIVSSDPYLRLSSKPQIFRPGLGHSNTTTRGAHTLDVISCSAQIAQQLGLNVDLCMAIAALHDIGHPAGGHVGEELIYELSGKKFKHHIFSLSLADLFSMNLQREVQVGAFYHKSGGGKLQAPRGKPEEYGVVRIADKVSYVPWDFFDSIRNGFISESKDVDDIKEILGNSPLEWINTLIEAVVVESASVYKVSFSSFSNEIYDAYKKARFIIFNEVHKKICWDRLKSDYFLAYSSITQSFPNVDPVPIIAYMTDSEMVKIAQLTESLPKNKILEYDDYSSHGFGFLDIIDCIKENKDGKDLYYSTIRDKL